MPADKCHVVQEGLPLAAKPKRYVIVFFIIIVNLRQMIRLDANISHENCAPKLFSVKATNKLKIEILGYLFERKSNGQPQQFIINI